MAEQSTDCLNTHLKRSTADKFFRDLDEKVLSFKVPADELENLQQAVHDIILQIVERVKRKDDRFTSRDVIRVGSYKEGTKIIEPNEFDYLVVIDELSAPGVVKSSRICVHSRGYMHLQVTDEITKDRWADYIDDGELYGFVLSSPCYRENKATSNAVGFTTLVMNVFTEQTSENKLTVSKPSGTLTFSGALSFREPNTVINLTWCSKYAEDPIHITADLSPAVRCYNVEEAITSTDCPYPIFYKQLKQYGSYLLTPGKSHNSLPIKCFRISLTEVEVNLVKSLGTTHKICYRVLKYVLANLCCKLSFSEVKYNGFSSYILKSAVLHHSADGQCNNTSIHECIKPVLTSLLNCLMNDKPHLPNMPSIFVQDHNLFHDLMRYHSSERGTLNIIMHVQSLMTFLFLTETLQDIPMEHYDYEKSLKMLDNFISDLKKAFKNAEKLAQTFFDEDGKWKINDMSTNDLLHKFGVPYKLLK